MAQWIKDSKRLPKRNKNVFIKAHYKKSKNVIMGVGYYSEYGAPHWSSGWKLYGDKKPIDDPDYVEWLDESVTSKPIPSFDGNEDCLSEQPVENKEQVVYVPAGENNLNGHTAICEWDDEKTQWEYLQDVKPVSLSSLVGGMQEESVNLHKIIEIKEKERKEWADMCILKQAEIDRLKRSWIELKEGCEMPDYDEMVEWHEVSGQRHIWDLDKDGNDWLQFQTHWRRLDASPEMKDTSELQAKQKAYDEWLSKAF